MAVCVWDIKDPAPRHVVDSRGREPYRGRPAPVCVWEVMCLPLLLRRLTLEHHTPNKSASV